MTPDTAVDHQFLHSTEITHHWASACGGRGDIKTISHGSARNADHPAYYPTGIGRLDAS